MNNRFQFWRGFWVILGIYMVFTLIGVIAITVSPATNTAYNWEKLVSWQNLVSHCISFSFYVAFFYLTLNTFYRLLEGRASWEKFVKPVIFAFALTAGYSTLSIAFNRWAELDISVKGKEPEPMTIGLAAFLFVIVSIFCTALSLIVAYLTLLRDGRKRQKVLEEQKMQLEVEKSQANFNFLKAQINPHFLHNTLNFLYAKSLPYSEELSEGILTLSDIMRYALSPSAMKDGKVMLKEEIEHVRNVIKINQLRFSNNLNVSFEVNGVVNGATIIPFILITIVENAFKHGDLKSGEHPISIRLDIGDGGLRFFCRNKKKSGTKELSTGIGLDNIKKQLDLTYGGNYRLDIRDEAEFYTTQLTITAV